MGLLSVLRRINAPFENRFVIIFVHKVLNKCFVITIPYTKFDSDEYSENCFLIIPLTRLRVGLFAVRLETERRGFFLLKTSRPVQGPTHPFMQWVLGAVFSGVERPELKLTTHYHLNEEWKERPLRNYVFSITVAYLLTNSPILKMEKVSSSETSEHLTTTHRDPPKKTPVFLELWVRQSSPTSLSPDSDP